MIINFDKCTLGERNGKVRRVKRSRKLRESLSSSLLIIIDSSTLRIFSFPLNNQH